MRSGSNCGDFFIMKYTILINQYSAVANGLNLDLIDLAIFDFIKDFVNSTSCIKMHTPEGIYFWVSHKLIIEEMPLLNIKTNQGLLKRIDNLINAGVLMKHPNCEKYRQTLYRFGENYSLLMFKKNDLQSPTEDYNPQRKFRDTPNESLGYNINNNNIKKESKYSNEYIDSKEKLDSFSKDVFSNEEKKVKASVEFGFTPESLDVRKQTIDKVDDYFNKLVFPFESEEFKRNFYILMCQPKWRTSQKSFSAIQANLNGLSKYPEEFALIMIRESISKGWAALEYDNTPEKYEKWEKMRCSVNTEQQRKKEYEDMMKYLNNDFD